MKDFFITALILLGFTTAVAQGNQQRKNLRLDLQLVMDNDVFTLDLSQDQYYSSGIYPAVRWLGDSTKKSKVIYAVQLNHRVFTPSWIGWTNESALDRPYAGQLSASVAGEFYYASNQYLKAQLEIGWMGPSTFVGETQATWHDWFGMPQPRGWKFQINDTPIINAYLTYLKPVYSSYNFEIAGESNLGLGTVFNYARQDIMFRFGKLKPLYKSAFTGAFLGNKRSNQPAKRTVESYFFYSPGVEYVFYNATIEGNIIGTRSYFTGEQINLVFQSRAGVMFSWPRFDVGFTCYWRTRENAKATRHKYAGIRMNQRF